MATGAEGNRYGKNQFYNISKASPGEPTARELNDNPAFLWPGDTRRNAATGAQTKIQRGYIRLVSEVLGDDANIQKLGKRRFHFQFNPDTLTRSVSARNDVHLWMNQDPVQFTQPIPGDANFSFEIILNREAEMASGRYNTGNGISERRTGAADILNLNNPFSIDTDAARAEAYASAYNPSAVTDIGVLADLLVFDQIIGQGVNRELIESIINRSEAISLLKTKDNSNKDDEDDETQSTPTSGFDRTRATDYLRGAFGNSAFLISQPVRVVFSSLFMVEGFITSTTVVFNKFNSAMVPTQCMISVQMQAMYIGFAQKDTFLTVNYVDAEQKIEELRSEIESANGALSGLSKNLYSELAGTATSQIGAKYVLDSSRVHYIGVLPKSPSEELKTYANDKQVKVTAHAVYRVTYTQSSPAYAALGSDFKHPLNSILYQKISSKEISNSALTNGLIFEFSPEPNVFPKTYDKGAEARYKVEFYLYFSLTSTNGGDVPQSDQYYSFVKENTTWADGNSVIDGTTRALSNGGIPADISRVVGN
jgi:hypothetical protein